MHIQELWLVYNLFKVISASPSVQSDYEIFPQALFGVFLGGDMFVFSAMATKVKVTKNM